MRDRRRIDPLELLWVFFALAAAAGSVYAGVLTHGLNPGDTITRGAREWGWADIAAGAAMALGCVAFLVTRRRGFLVGATLLVIVPVLHITT